MTQAVFLSYASQDADAARRICDALRAAGLEVWFDQSELRGGDAWDASINYPLRGAVTWKSTVGTNVASDALSNLASAGVKGGTLIVIGEDYGEGASIIQERTHAFAMKSQIWLLDPRPNLPTIVNMMHGVGLTDEWVNAVTGMHAAMTGCWTRG